MGDPVSGILSTIDLVLKYGGKLHDAYCTYRNSDPELKERALRFSISWFKTREEVRALRSVYKQLPDEFLQLQHEILAILKTKLEKVDEKLAGVQKAQVHDKKYEKVQDIIVRLKYVWAKDSIDEVIHELESWQERFSPLWYLSLRQLSIERFKTFHSLLENHFTAPAFGRTPSSSMTEDQGASLRNIKASLQVPVRGSDAQQQELRRRFPENSKVHAIELSCAKVLAIGDARYIMDTVAVEEQINDEVVRSNISRLAAKFIVVDPSQMGILQCRAWMPIREHSGELSYGLVFHGPTDRWKDPRSLRFSLGTAMKHSLSERLKLARQLAKAVCFVHVLDFVHKNIRPETVLLFQQAEGALGAAFLVGFETFRDAAGDTQLRGDSDWEKNLYRHPDRQGAQLGSRYSMQHDIYSLGVCLLEIGLWESLVKYTTAGCEPAAMIAGADSTAASTRKDRLVELAKTELAPRMGDRYRDVVICCLRCLDPEDNDFADQLEFEDASGATVGARYMEKILLKLEDLRL